MLEIVGNRRRLGDEEENSTHHRHHRSGRRLPRRVPAQEGLRGARPEAAFVPVQYGAHRPSLRGPARPRAQAHPALRGHDRFDERAARGRGIAARRNLQPRRAKPCRGVLRGAGIHRKRRCAGRVAPARSDPDPRHGQAHALLSGVHLGALRPGARNAATRDDAVPSALALRRGEALRALDHGQLPRGLRAVRRQRHPVQPRIAHARRDFRHAQDHARAGPHPARAAGHLYLGNLGASAIGVMRAIALEAQWRSCCGSPPPIS